MSDDSNREHPSTYIVQDRSNLSEMERLQIQSRLLTASMGGVLAEQPDLAPQDVLDVGCATGDWLFEAAKAYPNARLVGIDVSSKMLEFAQAQAEAQGIADRVSFHVMDALRMLEFPDHSFDLINQRAGMSYLRTWDWPKLLQEYLRVCRPEGTIRITESDLGTECNSAALLRLTEILFQAFWQAGHLFTETPDGVISGLAPMLERNGLLHVQTRTHLTEYRGGTDAGYLYYEDMKRVFRNIVPFLRKWTRLPDDYEEIYQQALTDIQQPDFVATWRLLTAWCTTPPEHQET